MKSSSKRIIDTYELDTEEQRDKMEQRKRDGQKRRRKIEGGRREIERMQYLADWIDSVREKKLQFKRKYKLRMTAMLTRTLRSMEYEYRVQEISGIHRQPLKCVENVGIVHNRNLYNAAERRDIEYQQLISKRNNVWQGSLCEDLSSLDDFLQQLGQQVTSMESMEEKSEYFFQS
ncbi:uncharacterized protein LOC105250683 isoform X2 [Camponotus floridanus]|uniref:uncharacterized protein LOC105250683 isoform X2 n=1 Tax=Camponotus floridanus TaxID=104421 RepID=UPI00059C96CB|nr:uncharacterized protein LOC105250683 isoform X2 [Camponotus floridanus]